MAREKDSDWLQAEKAKERHFTLRVIFTGLFVLLLFGTMTVSCTYYNVELVKHPTTVDHVNSTSYERK